MSGNTTANASEPVIIHCGVPTAGDAAMRAGETDQPTLEERESQ